MTTRMTDILMASGNHASRPTTPAPGVVLYSCTDHNLIYRWNGSAWSTWATLGASGAILSSLVDAKGDLLTGTADNTVARRAVGMDGQVLTADSSQSDGVKWATPSASASILLATQSYNPNPQVQTNLGTSEADVDATNLAVTFTAPASGNVDIDVTILVIGVPGNSVYLTLRSGASTVAGTRGRVMTLNNLTGLNVQSKVTHSVRVTGLTAGNSYTYKLGAFYAGGSSAAQLGYGDTTAGSAPLGPALFKVWSA